MTEANTVNRPNGGEGPASRARTDVPAGQGGLVTPKGTTSIDSGVVAKIAGLAARIAIASASSSASSIRSARRAAR